MAGLRIKFNDTAMLLDEVLGEAQAKTCASIATSHKRVKNTFLQGVGDARAIVNDRHDGRHAVLFMAQ